MVVGMGPRPHPVPLPEGEGTSKRRLGGYRMGVLVGVLAVVVPEPTRTAMPEITSKTWMSVGPLASPGAVPAIFG